MINNKSNIACGTSPDRDSIKFVDRYESWEEAFRNSTGYDSEVILEKVRVALLKVKNGEAVYERDSVLFDEIRYSWPLLAGLMHVAAVNEGRLRVVDFGGSLGSTYFQNRHFLKGLKEVRWHIVEQPMYVDVGRSDFQDEELMFHHDLGSCIDEAEPQVIIFSGVLQFIEKPYDFLQEAFERGINFVIIDRMPFSLDGEKYITIQQVPRTIFDASYPMWVFSGDEFMKFVRERFHVLTDFDTDTAYKKPFKLRGFLLRKL